MRSNARSIMRRDAAAAVTLARGHEGRCDAGFLDFFKVTKPNENARAQFARAIGLQAEQRWKRSETTIDR